MARRDNSKRVPELLAPAGSLDKLKVAVHYGADAIYFGGPRYSLRAHAVMTETESATAIEYAHDHGVKAYATMNIFAHERDFAGIERYVQSLVAAGIDGLIVSDPGILGLIRALSPEMPIHLSTQANVTNSHSARFWEGLGVKRLNLAREQSIEEIRAVREAVGCEIEVFVHGALCISYSGRCLLSCDLTGRNANQGDCAHPCRYSYRLVEEKRPGDYYPIEEDSRGTYILNSKDLCLLRQLPRLVALDVDALKIEGRMKSPYYVGGVVRVYRAALDYLATQLPRLGKDGIGELTMPDSFMVELEKFSGRGYTENFLHSPPGPCDMRYETPRSQGGTAPVGFVRHGGDRPTIEIRTPVKVGQIVEHLGPGSQASPYLVIRIISDAGIALLTANPGSRVFFETSPPNRGWRENDLLRTSGNTSG